MENNEKSLPIYFEAAQAGKSLKEVGVDYIQVESQNITSRWFHSAHDVDLFIWLDEKKNVIKQQISFCGQIVEWNILDGLKTGVVVEEEVEFDSDKVDSSEIIRFDLSPQRESIRLAIEVINHIESLEDIFRKDLLSNFNNRTVLKMNPRRPANFWQKLLQVFKKSA
jgi:hypothetical protein